MRLYIAGPMTGHPEFNFPAFHDAARRLRQQGYDVCNPAEMETEDTTKPWAFYARRSVGLLVQDCDAVLLLSGWSDSRGALLEAVVARALGLPFYRFVGSSLERCSTDHVDQVIESKLDLLLR
ncbi:MAG: DUF4406 domain-containing protein [Limnochordia bacterium]|jgi:hypothetical protein